MEWFDPRRSDGFQHQLPIDRRIVLRPRNRFHIIVECNRSVAPLPDTPAENFLVKRGGATDIDGGNLDVTDFAVCESGMLVVFHGGFFNRDLRGSGGVPDFEFHSSESIFFETRAG